VRDIRRISDVRIGIGIPPANIEILGREYGIMDIYFADDSGTKVTDQDDLNIIDTAKAEESVV
jgi:hypothetical protein